MILTYDKGLQDIALAALGKKTDDEGYIVDSQSGERVITRNGEEVKASELGVIKKGSEIFVKSDIASLIEFVDSEEDQQKSTE